MLAGSVLLIVVLSLVLCSSTLARPHTPDAQSALRHTPTLSSSAAHEQPAGIIAFPSSSSPSALPSIRPPPSQRKFNSSAINSLIVNVTARMADADLATLFSNCLPCTLDTTVVAFSPRTPTSPPDAFFITGDIFAQWLRDSTNQVLPYIPYASQDRPLQDLVCGLIRRQSAEIVHDPYANSFNINATGAGHQDDFRRPAMTAEVFEGKWELDSLAAAMKLAARYYNATQDAACFLEDDLWAEAVKAIVSTITEQQKSTAPPSSAPYLFQRQTSNPTDSQMLGGVGNIGRRTGMCKTAFRPSDDATLFPFFIPANAMAVVELRHITQLLLTLAEHETVRTDVQRVQRFQSLAATAASLADEMDAGIQQYGIVPLPVFARSVLPASTAADATVYAYEVDGYGGQTLMDDANVPSLLSLPYLGYTTRDDSRYRTTRALLLSAGNPYFFNGSAAVGIGGPHVGIDYIWPMSIVMRAMTSGDDDEIRLCLQLLKDSSAGTGWLHESFHRNNVKDFTRPWFAWVNGLFGSLILQLAEERPYLIFKQAAQQSQ